MCHWKRFFSYFSLPLVLMLVSTWAIANSHTNKATQLIERVLHHHVKILHAFPAPDNLIGYIVQAGKGKPTILYADKQGHYILFGALFDHNGKNLTALTQQHYQQHAPTSHPGTAPSVITDAAKTSWFEQGNPHAAHQLYVVAEPNCSACHFFYNTLQPYIGKGLVTIRWIMVGFLKPSSPGKAMAIMMAKNPAKALWENETHFDATSETGGIAPIPSRVGSQHFARNMAFIHHHHFTSTPILIYRDKTGKVSLLKGALPNKLIPNFINQLGHF